MTTAVTTSTPVKWNRKEFNLGIVYKVWYKNPDKWTCQDFFKECQDFFKECQDFFKVCQDFFKDVRIL